MPRVAACARIAYEKDPADSPVPTPCRAPEPERAPSVPTSERPLSLAVHPAGLPSPSRAPLGRALPGWAPTESRHAALCGLDSVGCLVP